MNDDCTVELKIGEHFSYFPSDDSSGWDLQPPIRLTINDPRHFQRIMTADPSQRVEVFDRYILDDLRVKVRGTIDEWLRDNAADAETRAMIVYGPKCGKRHYNDYCALISMSIRFTDPAQAVLFKLTFF